MDKPSSTTRTSASAAVWERCAGLPIKNPASRGRPGAAWRDVQSPRWRVIRLLAAQKRLQRGSLNLRQVRREAATQRVAIAGAE
jgi:hypothetical protein